MDFEERLIEAVRKLKYQEFLQKIKPVKDALQRNRISLKDLFEMMEGEKLKEIEKEIREKIEGEKREKKKEEKIEIDKEAIEEFFMMVERYGEEINLISKEITRERLLKGGRPPDYPIDSKIRFVLFKEFFLFSSTSQCYDFLEEHPEISRRIGPLPRRSTILKFLRVWGKVVLPEARKIIAEIKSARETKELFSDERIIKEIKRRQSAINVLVSKLKKAPYFREPRVHSSETKIKALIFAQLKGINYFALSDYLRENNIWRQLGFEVCPTKGTFSKFLENWGEYIKEGIENLSQQIKEGFKSDKKIKEKTLKIINLIEKERNIQQKIKEVAQKIEREKPRTNIPFYEALLTIITSKVANPVIWGKESEVLEFLKQRGNVSRPFDQVSMGKIERTKAMIKEMGFEKEIQEIVTELAIRMKKETEKETKRETEKEMERKSLEKKEEKTFKESLKIDKRIRKIIWDLFNEDEKDPKQILKIVNGKFDVKLSENVIQQVIKEEIERRGGRRCWQCDDFREIPRKKKWGWCNVRRRYVRKNQYICEKMI